MILYGDYHTHTVFSHGKGSILENALIAAKKGLQEIAITEHGVSSVLYRFKWKNLEDMRAECEEAERLTGVKVLLGIESNFITNDGDIDITPEQCEKLDVILCGYHKIALSKKGFFGFFLRNLLLRKLKTKKQIRKNTDAIKAALSKNKIHVLTHLNADMKVDVCEVARHAKHCGTLIELNGRRLRFTDNEIKQMVSDGVRFIVNSDAHIPENVGECNQALALITRLQIPLSLIANIDKTAEFR